MRYAGEIAALGTACCWAVGSNLFAGAGRRVGSRATNRVRIVMAAVLLGSALWITRGSPWPWWATSAQVTLLAASGLVGFAFGDTWYFRSLVILGPGRAGLLASLAPVFTALIGWPLLGQALGLQVWAGIALTLGGIAWVVQERRREEYVSHEGSRWMGVTAGILGALGQAVGYVLSGQALASGIDALPATVVRVDAAAIAMWIMAGARREVPATLGALRHPRDAWMLAGGSFFGPFLGVTLSLAALQYIEAGVAASLIAIHPVLTILIASRFHREPISARTLGGAAVAVAGVVVLFLR